MNREDCLYASLNSLELLLTGIKLKLIRGPGCNHNHNSTIAIPPQIKIVES